VKWKLVKGRLGRGVVKGDRVAREKKSYLEVADAKERVIDLNVHVKA